MSGKEIFGLNLLAYLIASNGGGMF